MHPVGLFLGLLIALFQRKWRLTAHIISFLLLFVIIFNYLEAPAHRQARELVLNIDDPFELLFRSEVAGQFYGKLRSEGTYVLAILCFYLICRFKLRVPINFPKVNPVIFLIMAIVVAGMSFESHLRTGGPFGIFLIPFYPEGSIMSSEKMSIIFGTWISPFVFSNEVLVNQYPYRE